jgi:CRP-like cAMP-binding protein
LESKDGVANNFTLKTGDYFGDSVLFGSKIYAATVIALQTTVCFKLERFDIQEILASQKGSSRFA